MKNSFLSLVIAGASVGIVALGAACSSSDSTPATSSSSSSGSSGSSGSDGGGEGGEATPTFTEIYTTILATKCAPCHTTAGGSGIKEGDLDMTSQAAAYTNLVGVAAAGAECTGKGTRIVAGKPDDSIMYLKVSDDDPTPCGGKMPLGSQGLDSTSSDAIEAWITAGAKND